MSAQAYYQPPQHHFQASPHSSWGGVHHQQQPADAWGIQPYHQPQQYSGWGAASTPFQNSSHAAAVPSSALVLYNPVGGLPSAALAFSSQNPFAPGLSPTSGLSPPAYATEDPLKQRFPAQHEAYDPLNWITEDLFDLRAQAQQVAESRRPISNRAAYAQQ